MKRLSAFALVSTLLALTAAALSAESAPRASRQPRVVTRHAKAGQLQAGRAVPSSVTATGYSAQLNIVTRVQGLSFYRTAVDITNNTGTNGVNATFQYCYTLGGVYQGCTAQLTITLAPFDGFHDDDIVNYLGVQGVLSAAAQNSSFGTFIVTFDSLPSNNGWEATLLGRTYSPIDQANPLNGAVAIAYPGSLFFESATGSLVGLVRDTRPAPTQAGALRTNLGVTNTALFNTDPNGSVDFRVTFYDTVSGAIVGDQLTPSHPLSPGEVYQINDVFTTAHIPSDIVSCIVFVDIISTQGVNPDTIEGYIDILDGGTNDGAYFEMKCSAGCGSF